MTPDGSIRLLAVKAAAYFAPAGLVLGLAAGFLSVSGELVDIEKLAARQAEGPEDSLLGLAYSNPVFRYKSLSVALRKPEVIALGSSRVMEFRDFFFKDRGGFYNAGGGVSMLQHYGPFVQSIPADGKLKLIVLGLDHSYFNDKRPENARSDAVTAVCEYRSALKRGESGFQAARKASLGLIRDLFSRRLAAGRMIGVLALAGSDRYGFTARIKGNGFMHDGSYRYWTIDRSGMFDEFLSYIETGGPGFEHGNAVSISALRRLDEFLGYCRSRSIHVAGFLPPYAPTVFSRLRREKAQYGYIHGLGDRVGPVFARHAFSFRDFTDATGIGGTDREFVDGIHGSERLYAKLFVEMAEKDASLAEYADIRSLKELLSSSTDQYRLYHAADGSRALP